MTDVSRAVADAHRREWARVLAATARDPRLALNTSKADPGMAARTIDHPDLNVWYEIIDPVRVVTWTARR